MRIWRGPATVTGEPTATEPLPARTPGGDPRRRKPAGRSLRRRSGSQETCLEGCARTFVGKGERRSQDPREPRPEEVGARSSAGPSDARRSGRDEEGVSVRVRADAAARSARFRRAAAVVLVLALAMASVLATGGCLLGRSRVTVVDDAGREVTLERVPERIVSMAPSNTEILFALGVGEKVVGVTSFCNYPPEVAGVEKVGDAFAPDYEKIVSLKPDLVLAVGTAESQLVKGLEGYGMKVLVLQAQTVDQVLEDIELVGKVTGTEKQARELAEDIRSRVEAVRSKTAQIGPEGRARVFWCLDSQLWTVGPGSFVNDLIAVAGGVNVAAGLGQPYGQFSMESLLEADPDVIVIPVLEPSVPADLARLDGWSRLEAVRQGRVFTIDPDLVSRPGPRIAEAIESLAALLYPDLFGAGGN